MKFVYLLDESGRWHVAAHGRAARAVCGVVVVPLVRSTTNQAQVNRRRLCPDCKAKIPA